MVSTETCILLPQKITVLGQLWKPLIIRFAEPGCLLNQNHIPCRQNHPEDIPKNKTQHYSGITMVSREKQPHDSVAFFTIPGGVTPEIRLFAHFSGKTKRPAGRFLETLSGATYWKMSCCCKSIVQAMVPAPRQGGEAKRVSCKLSHSLVL